LLRNPFVDLYLLRFSKHRNTYRKIFAITGFVPRNITCYMQALRHHSVSNTVHENGQRDSNERLEYLGDSVLNTVIAELLFVRYPYKQEGFLTEMRSKIVSRNSLNDLSLKIGLKELLHIDKKMLGMNTRNTIYGNALEAFIGAIYLDAGYAGARRFIYKKLLVHIDLDNLQSKETNFKGRLIEWAQKVGKTVSFDTEEFVNQKQKIYKISIVVDGAVIAVSENISKKKAEQMAAEIAFEQLNIFAN
jgi:ribonuclease-3